jgi:hypothetical protein
MVPIFNYTRKNNIIMNISHLKISSYCLKRELFPFLLIVEHKNKLLKYL